MMADTMLDYLRGDTQWVLPASCTLTYLSEEETAALLKTYPALALMRPVPVVMQREDWYGWYGAIGEPHGRQRHTCSVARRGTLRVGKICQRVRLCER